VSVIFIVFLILCGLHHNHLFIWLDPEVVAHDALIATKVGYLNFFGLLEQYSFWVDGIYIDITLKKVAQIKMKLIIVFYKKLQYFSWFFFLYCNRVNYVMGLDYVY
jgi:hypothetical protein